VQLEAELWAQSPWIRQGGWFLGKQTVEGGWSVCSCLDVRVCTRQSHAQKIPTVKLPVIPQPWNTLPAVVECRGRNMGRMIRRIRLANSDAGFKRCHIRYVCFARSRRPRFASEVPSQVCMSGITPQLQAAARSAYRNLYRASASTFAGEWPRNDTGTSPLNSNAGEQVTMRSSRVGSRFRQSFVVVLNTFASIPPKDARGLSSSQGPDGSHGL